jgi:hypothetical protein
MSEKPKEDNIVITMDSEKVKKELLEEMHKEFKELKEAVIPKEKAKSGTEPLEVKRDDYRIKLVEALTDKSNKKDFIWRGEQDSEDAKKIVGEASPTKKMQEAIGAVTATYAIPDIWASEVERLSVYPNSAFLDAPYINWKDDIKGKPGDSINVITVGPGTCIDLACEEPTTTAGTILKVPITLANKVCAYYICKADMEDVVPDTIDALNEGLSSCLSECVDNYFLTQAQIGINRGTLTETGAMKGTTIAKAMGSMQAGTYQPYVLIMHPVVYKGLMQDSQFTSAATFGNRNVIERGEIDSFLGVQMVEVPKGTLSIGGGTYRSLLLAKGAICGAKKHDVELETEYVAREQKKYVLASIRFGGTVVHTNGVFWIVTVQ